MSREREDHHMNPHHGHSNSRESHRTNASHGDSRNSMLGPSRILYVREIPKDIESNTFEDLFKKERGYVTTRRVNISRLDFSKIHHSRWFMIFEDNTSSRSADSYHLNYT